MGWLTRFLPNWLNQWFQLYAAAFFKVQLRAMLHALFLGAIDAVLFFTLPFTISLGSQAVWNARYQLTPTQQHQVEEWANISQLVAYIEDVPPVVPLVLWYKENGLRAENPSNCEGIMGLHTAVNTGALPCFPEGPIGAWDVAYQLQLGARTFKEYCPEITYTATNPRELKRCYLYYNAGPQTQLEPDDSAYVMNGYDDQHQNMVLTDAQGREHRISALGAWPIHITIQTQLALRRDPPAPLVFLAPAMLAQEAIDRAWTVNQDIAINQGEVMVPAEETPLVCRVPKVQDCFIAPSLEEEPDLRPKVSPLLITPAQIGEIQCGLLPGLDMAPSKTSVVLAPMPGYLRRYADGVGNLAVHIENEAWSVWITGLRSYTVPDGEVEAGATVGVIGGTGSQTPSVHYAIYDKRNAGFVDPLGFVPRSACAALD